MENSEPNKIVARLWKRFEANKQNEGDKYYTEQELIGKEAKSIVQCIGAVSVMSSKSILRLIAIQSNHRFMPDHSFYIYFSKDVS